MRGTEVEALEPDGRGSGTIGNRYAVATAQFRSRGQALGSPWLGMAL